MARQTLLSFLGSGKVKKEEKGSLNMVEVEEDIFGNIPEKESAVKEKGEKRAFPGAGWRDSESEEKTAKEEWKTETPKQETDHGIEHETENHEESGSGKESFGEQKTGGDVFQDIIEPEHEVEKSKSIYFEIVLDKTLSMAKNYKRIYEKLEKMIDNMDRAVKSYQKKGKVGLKWGLTLITEGEPEKIRFGGSCFTAFPNQIKNALKEFQFEGGSENGRENINEALIAAIQALSEESQGEGKCGLILITDSLPEEDDMEPDFEYLENVKYTALCFAHCFVYDCEAYTPYFNMVDGEGETDVKGIHYLEIRDLDAYLNREADNLTEKLLKKLLHYTSVSV